MTDLLYDDTEEALRASVRALLTAYAPAERVLARLAEDTPYDMGLWARLAGDLEVAGLAVPQEYGGAGAGPREVAVVLEELGRAVAPVPYLGSAVVATRALLSCGAADLLRPVAEGQRCAALAVGVATAAVPGKFSAAPGGFSAAPGGFSAAPGEFGAAPGEGRLVRVDGDSLTGVIPGVLDALAADLLLVPAGDGLYAVDVPAPGVTVTPVVSLDQTRPLADVRLADAAARRIATGAAAATAVTDALLTGAGLLCSEQVGVAQWCLDTAVEYARVRHQFGRPIGSFQAVKHRLADVWVSVCEARALARHAADCLATGDPDTALAVSVAQAHCSPVAVAAAEACVQVHGGIGFTWEHPAHLYLKRAKSDAVAFGTAGRHRAVVAALADLPAPA